MERYSHIQNLPNSPLTPLTPLSENTSFNFNFGGDGSLDMYIENVRKEHRVEQQQKKLLQQANRTYRKLGCPMQPKRFTEEFLKIRDVFECQGHDEQDNCMLVLKDAPKKHYQHKEQILVEQPKCPTVKITHTGATPTNKVFTSTHKTPTSTIQTSTQKMANYVMTPTNIRTPLKQKDHNTLLNIPSKSSYAQQQKRQENIHYQQQHRHQAFRQASPVALKPLCPRVAKILNRSGLSVYSAIFQREEIDMYVFQFLTPHDLQQMGIKNPKHCEIIMTEIYYALQYQKCS